MMVNLQYLQVKMMLVKLVKSRDFMEWSKSNI